MDKGLKEFVVSVMLVLVLTGCGLDIRATNAVTPAPTETLKAVSVVQDGELVEVQLDTVEISLDELFNLKLEGDYLYANVTRGEKIQWVVIHVPGGQIYGLDSGPTLADAGALPQRFVARWQWGTPGELNQVFAYDCYEEREKDIPLEGDPWYPVVDGDRLVWSQRQGEQWSIQGYDLAQEQAFEVIPDLAELGSVNELRISGDWVAFVDHKGGRNHAELYLHHIGSDETLHLATLPYWKPFSLENERIAWRERNEGYIEIHVYDLVSQQERVVYRIHDDETGCRPMEVHLAGDLAFWTCDKKKHGLDLVQGTEFDLPLFLPYEGFQGGGPSLISETRLIWFGDFAGGESRHMYTVPIVRE